jgi:hypothetical protein
VLVGLDHVASIIVNTNHSGVWGCILHIIEALDNVFCVDKVEDSGLKFFGSDCEYFGVGEAVY